MNHDLLTAIYRRLLWLYPARFRRDYGTQMVQTFRDCLRDAPTPGATMRLWWASLLDLFVNAGAERLRQMMNPTHLVGEFLFVAGLVSLLLSGVALFWTVWGITIFLLIPWDVGYPPPGTFAQAVNNFFETGYTSLSIPCIVILCNLTMMIRAMQRREHRPMVILWRFTGVNIVTSVIGTLIALFGAWIAALLYPVYDVWEGDQSRGVAYVYWGLIVTGGLIAFHVIRVINVLLSSKRKKVELLQR